MSKLTFEEINKNQEIKSLVESQKNLEAKLLQRKYWLSEDFMKEYNKRHNTFSNDENILKKDFLTWHKIECEKLYDSENDCLKIHHTKRITKFLSIHPWLTAIDEKRIQLAKENIRSQFVRTLYFNSFIVFPLGVSYILRRNGVRSRKQISKVLVFRIFSFLGIFTLFQDIVYKKLFYYQSLNKKFKKDKIFQKYFRDYLNTSDEKI